MLTCRVGQPSTNSVTSSKLPYPALKIRLERLGLVYATEEGDLYPSRQEYEGQMHLR